MTKHIHFWSLPTFVLLQMWSLNLLSAVGTQMLMRSQSASRPKSVVAVSRPCAICSFTSSDLTSGSRRFDRERQARVPKAHYPESQRPRRYRLVKRDS